MKLRFASYLTLLFFLTTTSSLLAQTFSNPTSIQIVDNAAANPYPSSIVVSGIGNSITKVTVTLTGFNHTFPNDVDILLVGPGNQTAMIFSDVGGGPDLTMQSYTITLDDDAPVPVPDAALASGTFQPTNVGAVDPFPAGPPAFTASSVLSVFNGTDPNGTWRLFVVDDTAVDEGMIGGGWSITITAIPEPSTYAMAVVGAGLLVGLERFLRKKKS